MKIYQLQNPKQFLNHWKDSNLSQEQLLYMFARDVSQKFAAECVNEALGNKMEVSNALHEAIEKKFNSIEWDN